MGLFRYCHCIDYPANLKYLLKKKISNRRLLHATFTHAFRWGFLLNGIRHGCSICVSVTLWLIFILCFFFLSLIQVCKLFLWLFVVYCVYFNRYFLWSSFFTNAENKTRQMFEKSNWNMLMSKFSLFEPCKYSFEVRTLAGTFLKLIYSQSNGSIIWSVHFSVLFICLCKIPFYLFLSKCKSCVLC